MLTTRLRRLRSLLFGATLAALTLPGLASASHFASLGFGHDNVMPPGQGTSATCNYDDGCFIGINNFAGDNAIGLIGRSAATTRFAPGVLGESKGWGPGVRGINTGTGNYIGVQGRAGNFGYGGHFQSANSGIGVVAQAGAGGIGVDTSAGGVEGGHLELGYGVRAHTFSQVANAAGVLGSLQSNAANAAGVRGNNTSNQCCGMGVAGFHSGAGIGVYGEAPSGFAVSGFSPDNWSGYFQGSVRVVGNLQKNSGSFTIDHPLDPANKYLSHSFVESPDMKNVYDGVVRTGRRGFATVKLPSYFGALNRTFRYQLTIISKRGWNARAAVWDRIEGNRFTIRTTQPGVTVSWQVTGIRKDRWANAHRIKVEEHKTGAEAGKYLNPELYGKPLMRSVVVLPGMQK